MKTYARDLWTRTAENLWERAPDAFAIARLSLSISPGAAASKAFYVASAEKITNEKESIYAIETR